MTHSEEKWVTLQKKSVQKECRDAGKKINFEVKKERKREIEKKTKFLEMAEISSGIGELVITPEWYVYFIN